MTNNILPIHKRWEDIADWYDIAQIYELEKEYEDKEAVSVNGKGLNLIKSFEGFRKNPYDDGGGRITIGYGFTYYPNGRKVRLTDDPISKTEANVLLKKLVMPYSDAVKKSVKTHLTQRQFNVLTSFCYNVGISAFKSSTLLKVINNFPNDEMAIRHEFGRWIYDNGREVPGLVNRRKKEANLYFKK